MRQDVQDSRFELDIRISRQQMADIQPRLVEARNPFELGVDLVGIASGHLGRRGGDTPSDA